MELKEKAVAVRLHRLRLPSVSPGGRRRLARAPISLSPSLSLSLTSLSSPPLSSSPLLPRSLPQALRSLADQQAGVSGADSAVSIIISSGGVPALVENLAGSADAQAHAAAALAHVCRTSSAQQLEIVRLNGLPPLAAILRAGGTAAMEHAAAAVAGVSERVENQPAVCKAGAVAPLVAMLKSGTENGKVYTCRAIGNLAVPTEAGDVVRDCVLKAGGVKTLLKLLSSGKTQEFAARAIARLSHANAAVQPDVCRSGGIAALLALLSGINVEAQTQAAAALAELAKGA
jgi:hypothetical protein